MKLSVAGLADLARGNQSRLTAPIDYDPREGSSADMEERVFQVLQRGASVEFRSPSTPPRVGPAVEGSPLGYVRSRDREFLVAPLRKDDFWRDGTPPAWAADWGEDEFGRRVAFEFEGVRQRMRWVEPGTFRMGSPEDEPGRYEEGSDWNEGPQHLVTITQGYWLFDTPCTQALWEAVMGENPSRFKSSDRPVDNVTWEDCLKSFETANKRLPGPDFVLPTEAPWEYACRAGTETATYAGAVEILGECNAPALDAIAWYTGNSGVDFELENGHDSSGWRNKQYDHQRAGSHPVANKSPNPWGLYDMLGNVWEWCHDGIRQYTGDPLTDPVGPTDSGAGRALRGGSWSSHARYVRCAGRVAHHPGLRSGSIGFRPARVQQ